MMKLFKFFLIPLISFLSVSVVQAQTEVTFKVNIKPQLKDSTLIPGRGDEVQLKGNLYPLQPSQPITMKDENPVDSVYTATVEFPQTQQGKTLYYKFILQLPERTITESMPRQVNIQGEEIELDPLYFDAFAW